MSKVLARCRQAVFHSRQRFPRYSICMRSPCVTLVALHAMKFDWLATHAVATLAVFALQHGVLRVLVGLQMAGFLWGTQGQERSRIRTGNRLFVGQPHLPHSCWQSMSLSSPLLSLSDETRAGVSEAMPHAISPATRKRSYSIQSMGCFGSSSLFLHLKRN